MAVLGHYHLHSETGACYGDYSEFDTAAIMAAHHAYPWCVPDHDPIDEGILTVIDAPFCMYDCREAGA